MQPQFVVASRALPFSKICPGEEVLVGHRLAAVVAMDIVGYARLMSLDESGTYVRYKLLRRELIDPILTEFGVGVVKSTGDGVLAELRTALNAVRCAVEIQQCMAARNRGEPENRRVVFRIGLSYGRIIVEPTDMYGDEVNIAARLQSVAPPGGIALTGQVAASIQGQLSLHLDDAGMKRLHNIERPIQVYVYR